MPLPPPPGIGKKENSKTTTYMGKMQDNSKRMQPLSTTYIRLPAPWLFSSCYLFCFFPFPLIKLMQYSHKATIFWSVINHDLDKKIRGSGLTPNPEPLHKTAQPATFMHRMLAHPTPSEQAESLNTALSLFPSLKFPPREQVIM